LSSTLLNYLNKAENWLREKNIASPRLEAQVIFAHFLQLKRYELFTQSDRPLNADEVTALRELLTQKARGVPTAYILQSKEFYGVNFYVDASVLIPRPETEYLCEQIIQREKSVDRIADLGCGSGCIGITLGKHLAAQEIVLADISADALSVAEKNARQSDFSAINFRFLELDFTAENVESQLPNNYFDLIVSNPPYVLGEEWASLDHSVRNFEPQKALLAEKFSDLHEKLGRTVYPTLRSGGVFYVETHPQKLAEVARLMENIGFTKIEILNDLSARPHFLRLEKL